MSINKRSKTTSSNNKIDRVCHQATNAKDQYMKGIEAKQGETLEMSKCPVTEHILVSGSGWTFSSLSLEVTNKNNLK